MNSVIAAATIRARLEGVDVVGIRDGFEWLMQGDVDHVTPLTIDAVSRIHFRGGSHLGIARANPTTSAALLEQTVNSLLRLNVTQLITIGGDDTAFSAMRLERHAAGAIRDGGGRAIAVQADLGSRDSIDAAIATVERELGQVSVLVTATSAYRSSRLPETSDEDWDAVVDDMLGATFRACRAVIPSMQAAGFGRIVNIAARSGVSVRFISFAQIVPA